MTITHIGEFTVGGLMPGVVTAYGAVEGNLLQQLAAKGALKLSLTAGPPSVAAAAQIGANVAASVTSPTFGAALTADLVAIAAINAQLAALAGIIASLGALGVELYAYTGTAAGFGAAVAGETSSGIPGGSGSDIVNALVLATRFPAVWAALGNLMVTA